MNYSAKLLLYTIFRSEVDIQLHSLAVSEMPDLHQRYASLDSRVTEFTGRYERSKNYCETIKEDVLSLLAGNDFFSVFIEDLKKEVTELILILNNIFGIIDEIK